MPVNFKEFQLKLLRKDLSLSQEELAIMLEVSRSRLSRIENFKDRLSFDQVSKLKEKVLNFDSYERQTAINQNSDEHNSHNRELKAKIEALKQVVTLKDEIISSKQDQINLLKVQLGNTITNLGSSSVNISSHNKRGDFVNWNIIDIPSDEYLEVMPGIFDRTLSHKENLIYEWESLFIPLIETIDFYQFRVLLNHSKRDTVFDTHFHVEKESIIVVEGIILEVLTNTIISKNESIQFESMQPHEMKNLTDTKLIILLSK